jgi:hypothetical protein
VRKREANSHTHRAEDRIEKWHGSEWTKEENRDAAYNFVLAMMERAVRVEVLMSKQ